MGTKSERLKEVETQRLTTVLNRIADSSGTIEFQTPKAKKESSERAQSLKDYLKRQKANA